MIKRYKWIVALLMITIIVLFFVYYMFIKTPWWVDLLYSDNIHPIQTIADLDSITMVYEGREWRRRACLIPYGVVLPRNAYQHVFTINNLTEFIIRPPWPGDFWGIPGSCVNESFGHVLEFFDGAHWRMVPASYFMHMVKIGLLSFYYPMDSWELVVDIDRIYGNLQRGLYRFRVELFVHWMEIGTLEGYVTYGFPVNPPGPHHVFATFYVS